MQALAVRGVELDWSESGEGPAALLIHETATSREVWAPVVDALEGRVSAVRYDRRGWAASTAPDGYLRTTIEEQSEDAAELIASRDSGPAVLCGAGTGAVIALDLLLRRPGLVSGAVLIEPPLLALLPEATEVLSADRRALEAAAAEGREALIRLYLSGGLGALGAGAQRLPEQLTGPARERPVSLIAELGAVPGWTMPLPRLAEAQRPSVILSGPSTPALIAGASTALAGRLARSEAREVPAAGRPPHLDAPGEVADQIRRLGEVRARAAR